MHLVKKKQLLNFFIEKTECFEKDSEIFSLTNRNTNSLTIKVRSIRIYVRYWDIRMYVCVRNDK